jgi:hypothetical protein
MQKPHDDCMYFVDKILKKKTFPQLLYLVKWEGYDVKDATWETPQNLENVQDLIEQFERENEEKKKLKFSSNSGSYLGNKRLSDQDINDEINEEEEKKYKQHKKNKFAEAHPKERTIHVLTEDLLPEKVTNVKSSDGILYCKVKFSTGSDGTIVEDAYVPTSEISETHPKVLIDFYEANLKFK